MSKTGRRYQLRRWWFERRWAKQTAIILASGSTVHQHQSAMRARLPSPAGKPQHQPPRSRKFSRHTCTPKRRAKWSTATCRKCQVEEQQALATASPSRRDR